MGVKYDFSGWATKNDLQCSDGRIIRRDAFVDNDGQVVPLVWNHQHGGPENVLGHALLENRAEGVYAYCSFNETDQAQTVKSLVQHGDIKALSIYANKLKQKGSEVLHGAIREVSLVLAGANPGANIEFVIEHGDDAESGMMAYFMNDDSPINNESGEFVSHADTKDKENEDEKMEGDTKKKEITNDSTVQDVIDGMSEIEQKVLYGMVGQAYEDGKKEGGNSTMKHNVFEADEKDQENVLSHAESEAIFSDAKRYGSLKDAVLAHGVEDIEYLFPEAKSLNTPPEYIKRDDEWVTAVMNAVHHTPFARIKSIFADITEDDARAKGYFGGADQLDPATGRPYRDALGNMVDKNGNKVYKKEEVFGLLKRTTSPTTIYKKQKLDRDDVVDITDFDVVAWIKAEMRGMLNEEIARALLVGDNRLASSDDKINEACIRPIWTDADLYTIKQKVEVAANADENVIAKATIRAAVKARKKYKGSGNPVFYTTEDVLTDMLLLEDTNQHRLYKDATELAAAMRVSKIVTVPVMEGLTRVDSDSKTRTLAGIIVNLRDYNIGADKGGAVSMFEDFDIDYNAQKYLIETRCSGALIKPYSAIALEVVEKTAG